MSVPTGKLRVARTPSLNILMVEIGVKSGKICKKRGTRRTLWVPNIFDALLLIICIQLKFMSLFFFPLIEHIDHMMQLLFLLGHLQTRHTLLVG